MSSLLVAAGRTTAYGTSRHFAAAQQFGRIWSEADIKSQSRIYEYTLMITPPPFDCILPRAQQWPASARATAPELRRGAFERDAG
ncbi:MAG: hypothetical protein WBW00_08265, partial [Pseudolabrys sp.]